MAENKGNSNKITREYLDDPENGVADYLGKGERNWRKRWHIRVV